MNAFETSVIKKVSTILQKEFGSEPTGHDFWHFERVRRLAVRIAKEESYDVNMFVIELGALLHDIADWKFNSDELAAGKRVQVLLSKLKVKPEIIDQVVHIVDNVSFKGAKVANKMKSVEGKIVQDADRLDALGAVGVARVFATGAYLGHPMHDSKMKPVIHKSFATYKKGSTSINHFYEKIFLIKDMMNTKTAKKIAAKRHKISKDFVANFLEEWGK